MAIPPSEIGALAQTCPLFDAMPLAEVRQCLRRCIARHYEANTLIFRQNDAGFDMLMLVSGLVRVVRNSADGRSTAVAVLGRGDVVGEMSVLAGMPRSASIYSNVPTRVVMYGMEALQADMLRLPRLGFNMSRILARKVAMTADYAETQAVFDADTRLLHTLASVAERLGERPTADTRSLLLGMSQAELANLVGTSREWVNNRLRKWHARGLLSYKDGLLHIPSKRALDDTIALLAQGIDAREPALQAVI